MKVCLSWIKDYVDVDIPVEEMCEKMVMAGFEIESIENQVDCMSNVVVAKILKIEPHPDADRLQICSMDIGAESPVQIVTGADNVFEGALVPAALNNSKLPCGMHIKSGKLRGVVSNGMLCSGEELCIKESDYIGAEANGILILHGEHAAGTDMREILGMDDYIIDFKITANRPDCNSVIGIAREVAVALGNELRVPSNNFKVTSGDINEHITVVVKNYDLCPRYYGRVIRNVKIGQSPDWLKKRIKSSGMRPINNIVDITNFVMLETGQPMHAFDLRDISGSKIIIRNAHINEPMTTLDGKEHALSHDMLIIADDEKPSCIAGVMGGIESEIKEDTKEIFLESAKFRRDSVRRTARALGIRTESSARFEKGIDIIGVEHAMNRALQLVNDLEAGEIVEGVIDKNNGMQEMRELDVSARSVLDLLGIEIPINRMVEILNSLQIETTLNGDILHCKVPSFRDDVEGRADIAEEIMRIYGCDHIVGRPMTGLIARGNKNPQRLNDDRIKGMLINEGSKEITTYSFISSRAIETLKLDDADKRRHAITLLNPLGDEYSTMRTQLITSMLTVIATNYNRKNESARLFEFGKLFISEETPVTIQPQERPSLCIGIYGEDENFFTIKGIVERTLELFSVEGECERAHETYLHPGRSAVIKRGTQVFATFGEVHPDVMEKYEVDARVYIAEIDLPSLYEIKQKQIIYKPLPKFPAVERDIALICDLEMPIGSIEKTIRKAAGNLCESISLFDVYTGSQIATGQKSVAYRITLRSRDETLTEEHTSRVMEKIFQKLSQIGVNLRS